MNRSPEFQSPIKYAIEDSFPIVEINRLAIPERNAFKPIYQMHKWFARRASCVFRAILLGCMKPLPLDEKGNPLKSGAEIIMEEFYKDHTNDPDTNGKVVLDPFMGGGTTVVEALRLGCKVIGIDLNPVAWFIVKTEVEPVDIAELKKSFERLAERTVQWSGKSVKETLLEQYKTECPCCGKEKENADIIYTFWVKSAICTNTLCKKEVPLFSDYIIAAKTPSIKYSRDVECPACGKVFDWEREPASLVAEPELCHVSKAYSAGIGRTTARWSFSRNESVNCPWCGKNVKPLSKSARAERKKIPLTVLLCPHCASVWQWRGNLPDEVTCPVCKKSYDPKKGNVPKSGWFLCPVCGHTDRIINSIRSLPEDRLLPMRPYAIEGYCPSCAGDNEMEVESSQLTLDSAYEEYKTQNLSAKKNNSKLITHFCLISKNNGKFFKKISPLDFSKYQKTCEIWEKEKEHLLYPKQKIPDGQETHRLLEHHFYYWHQMFNTRQLLCLSTLLKAIDEEKDQVLKEMLLSGFQNVLDCYCLFAYYPIARQSLARMFTIHAFQPKSQPLENCIWGNNILGYTYPTFFSSVLKGKDFNNNPYDLKVIKNKTLKIQSKEVIIKNNDRVLLRSFSSTNISNEELRFDLVITDPPYGGNVNYSELSDFSYVWLNQILKRLYNEFAPDLTPKTDEIIENPTRGKSSYDFEIGLTEVFKECNRTLTDQGIVCFTFHHSIGETWKSLLLSICNSGFEIISVYPIHSEAENSPHLSSTKSISYDLIHVCRKRPIEHETKKRSWAGIRQEIRRRARDEIKAIESGRYGGESIAPADINIILIGKCLELYSRHYGAVIDHEGIEVPLKTALEEIRMMVDQLVTKEQPLPSELDDIDAESYVYLTSLCDHKEINSDDVHKATRGILEPDTLKSAGIIVKGRIGRGRTYEVKQPQDRFPMLLEKFKSSPELQENLFGEIEIPKHKKKIYCVDYIHFLMALVEGGDTIIPWLERFRGETPKIRAACEYLMNKNKNFAPVLKKILDLIDIGPLFKES